MRMHGADDGACYCWRRLCCYRCMDSQVRPSVPLDQLKVLQCTRCMARWHQEATQEGSHPYQCLLPLDLACPLLVSQSLLDLKCSSSSRWTKEQRLPQEASTPSQVLGMLLKAITCRTHKAVTLFTWWVEALRHTSKRALVNSRVQCIWRRHLWNINRTICKVCTREDWSSWYYNLAIFIQNVIMWALSNSMYSYSYVCSRFLRMCQRHFANVDCAAVQSFVMSVLWHVFLGVANSLPQQGQPQSGYMNVAPPQGGYAPQGPPQPPASQPQQPQHQPGPNEAELIMFD